MVIAALTVKIFAYGLTLLELSEANNSVASMVLFILLLVYLANENAFRLKKAQRARVLLAQEKKKAPGIA